MKKNVFGVFETVVPAQVNGQPAIPHNSKIKVSSHSPPAAPILINCSRSPLSCRAGSGLTGCLHGSNM